MEPRKTTEETSWMYETEMSQKVAQLLDTYMMIMMTMMMMMMRSSCPHWAWVPLGFQCYGFDHTGLSTHMTDIKEA
jgi:uncharacterized PurR-regulated membrane protein YhhQ (DUF165 family)